MRQFQQTLTAQVDLVREANNLSKFQHNFRKWDGVSFPTPLFPLVRPQVLVESYEEGDSIIRYVRQCEESGPSEVSKPLAKIGLHLMLKMMLLDAFVHADLHPGNILVQEITEKISKKKKPRLMLLDVGMVAKLSEDEQKKMLTFFKGVSERDGESVAKAILAFRPAQEEAGSASARDDESFTTEVVQMFQTIREIYPEGTHAIESEGVTEEGGYIGMGEMLGDLLGTCRRYCVTIDGGVTSVILTATLVEGFQRKLDSSISVLDVLERTLSGLRVCESIPILSNVVDSFLSYLACGFNVPKF